MASTPIFLPSLENFELSLNKVLYFLR
uniref:SEC7 domain-containing protein n=1 Tax=Mesocestoides corti TaxID=53468 RepID=A0A5K3FL74_MESCO